jgi:hypothetical protein
MLKGGLPSLPYECLDGNLNIVMEQTQYIGTVVRCLQVMLVRIRP